MNWIGAMPDSEIRRNEPMTKHTTFRVGGNADAMLTARSGAEIADAIKLARENGESVTVIGRGSNLLVRDGGIRGLVIKIGDGFDEVLAEGETITACAGARLSVLAKVALAHSLTGLEFAAGIPGGLGGAVSMNAGAYGGEMARIVRGIDALTGNGESVTLSSPEEFDFGYRQSRVRKEGLTVVGAVLALSKGNADDIRAYMDELAAKRNASQPLDLPSAGSVFKRPEGYFAGKLIQDAGLQGLRVGGAEVSRKHAGFIVNVGGATAKDVETLIGRVRDAVFEKFGVRLEPEIRILGEE